MSNTFEVPNSGFVTAGWVRARYAISNSTMYLWIKEGRLPRPIRIGARAVRFDARVLAAWEEKLLAGDDESRE